MDRGAWSGKESDTTEGIILSLSSIQWYFYSKFIYPYISYFHWSSFLQAQASEIIAFENKTFLLYFCSTTNFLSLCLFQMYLILPSNFKEDAGYSTLV